MIAAKAFDPLASVWMVRSIARQMSLAENEWALAQRVYRAAVDECRQRIAARVSELP